MIVQHFFIPGISHSSYLVGGDESCAVVDPSRDIRHYLEAAEEEDFQITHVLQTHNHADLVGGHLELAEHTGAAVYAPTSANCAFKHVGVKDGDTFNVDSIQFRVLETPGHTPSDVSYVAIDLERGMEPVAAFTGDCLFVGDVGRPDLFPGKARQLSTQLYDSLHTKLLGLPDYCEVYPTHGAGSLCGRAMSAKRWSTIGYERIHNHSLQIKDKDEFVKSLTTNMPSPPDHFSRLSEINRKGPALLQTLFPQKGLSPLEFKSTIQKGKTAVLDIRSYSAFSGQHIPGSYSIDLDLGGNLATFAGWVLPPRKRVLLVSDGQSQIEEACAWLRRVGIDMITGYLREGINAWVQCGLPTEHVGLLSADEMRSVLSDGAVLVDVRTREEHAATPVPNSINIPVPDLRRRHVELDREAPTILMCGSGLRASLGCSILKQKGFRSVYNAAGGMHGYTTSEKDAD